MADVTAGAPPIRLCVLGLGGGGFHLEAERLIRQLTIPVELVLVFTIASQVEATWAVDLPVVNVFVVRSPALRQDSRLAKARAFAAAAWRAWWIFTVTRPDCVLAVGTAQAIPFGLAGRFARVPMYFVESLTRVKAPSRTSSMVRRLRLARWHRVQWPAIADPPASEFKGSLIQ
jgi:UDP-N-acetylglucosamine:LPS N-acetylglucosamine transferase